MCLYGCKYCRQFGAKNCYKVLNTVYFTKQKHLLRYDSEMTPNELDPQFDEASTPHCNQKYVWEYSYRQNMFN